MLHISKRMKIMHLPQKVFRMTDSDCAGACLLYCLTGVLYRVIALIDPQIHVQLVFLQK